MGVVYLAHDTLLGRDVALKILPPDLVGSTDRLHRFVAEARAASALNHPYILTVYDIGTAALEGMDSDVPATVDLHYIAMEFVDGVTLRTRIEDDRADLGKTLDYLTQVAEGLAKAHAAGIIHRDLKPDNIMVGTEGFVKILDFGLAKLVEGSAPGDAPTVMQHQTHPGTVLGTVGYMSPEQAQGKPVDTRSDIFSFGCILYEAAAGRQPFAADSFVETLHRIINTQTPSLRDSNPGVPPELERIVRKCLAKDPEERYQTIKDVAIDLKAVRREATTLDQPVPHSATVIARPASSAEYLVEGVKRHKTGVFIAAAIAIAILLVAFGGADIFSRSDTVSVASQAMKVTRVTSTGKVTRATISPDGKYAVHVIQEAGKQGLWLRQIATGSNVNVLPPAEVTYLGLTFSKDGNYIYYVRRDGVGNAGTVYQMPTLDGSSSRKILSGADGPVTLSPDGRQLAVVRSDFTRGESALIVANIDGSGERILASRKGGDGFETSPAWSPDGETIALSVYRNVNSNESGVTLVGVPARGGNEIPIFDVGVGSILQIAWLPDGSGLFTSVADQSSGFFYQIWHVGIPVARHAGSPTT